MTNAWRTFGLIAILIAVGVNACNEPTVTPNPTNTPSPTATASFVGSIVTVTEEPTGPTPQCLPPDQWDWSSVRNAKLDSEPFEEGDEFAEEIQAYLDDLYVDPERGDYHFHSARSIVPVQVCRMDVIDDEYQRKRSQVDWSASGFTDRLYANLVLRGKFVETGFAEDYGVETDTPVTVLKPYRMLEVFWPPLSKELPTTSWGSFIHMSNNYEDMIPAYDRFEGILEEAEE